MVFLPVSLYSSDRANLIALYLKAYQSDKQGQYEEAIVLYKSLLELDPASSEIRNDLAAIHIKKSQLDKKELDKSEELLQKSMGLNPSNRRSLMMLAEVYTRKGATYKAKALYEKCIELDKEDTEAYMYLGSLYVAEKKYKDAISIYNKILEYDDDFILALYYSGKLHFELKEYEKAKWFFTKVLGLKPTFEPAFLDIGHPVHRCCHNRCIL
jgi:tetratricopeptide (TPR) repeat protein